MNNVVESTVAKVISTITEAQVSSVTLKLAALLVRVHDVLPKEAIALSTIFAKNMELLVQDEGEMFIEQMDAELNDIYVNDELIEVNDYINKLTKCQYIKVTNDDVVIGKKLIRALEQSSGSTAVRLASEGIVERKRQPKESHGSTNAKAIAVLEDTQFTVSTIMLDILRDVYKEGDAFTKSIIRDDLYVLKACAAMNPELAYVSEFFPDDRGRKYQSDYLGANSQTGDIPRSLQDLCNVSTDYDNDVVIEALLTELCDMTSEKDKVVISKLISEASNNPVKFIKDRLGKGSSVKKVSSFTKFSMLITKLRDGEKPYIGVAIGPDAKCSGPQNGGLMVADDSVLQRCGFSTEAIDDMYQIAADNCTKAGIKGMTRNGIKKAFMAVFYGGGWALMMDVKAIENVDGSFDSLWKGIDLDNNEEMEDRAKLFRKCIKSSFGKKLTMLMAAINNQGFDYDAKVCKYDKPVKYTLPNGFEVAMDYRVCINIDNEVVVEKKDALNVVVSTMNYIKVFKNMKFRTEEYDLAAYGRTGFVNLIQATDAIIADLIILHANKLGVEHVLCIHDCFRTNVHQIGLLTEAVKLAYLELYGTDKNEPTEFLGNLDILDAYFKGSQEATKEEYKEENKVHKQFYSNGARVLRRIGKEKFVDVVNDIANRKFFA